MIVVILASLLPLAFKDTTPLLNVLDKGSVGVFILDYALRLMTADFKLKKGPVSFLLYPVTFMALLDLLCILPSFTPVASGIRLLKIIRLLRTFRVLRAAKMFRYSRSIVLIVDVIRQQRTALLAVGSLAVGYILVSALVIFNIEPDSFETFFDAVYWATVSLTTVGYGDIYPVSTAGRVITMLSSILGIAVVALPAGIITAGYMDRLNQK
jgi:voltage-gated potassium channel